MQRQFFSGNSIEQAVMAAARHYKIDPEKLSYKQREKKHGFLNVRKRIVIEVNPDAPELTDDEIAARRAPVAQPIQAAPPAPAPEPEEAQEPQEDFDDEEDFDEDFDDEEDSDDEPEVEDEPQEPQRGESNRGRESRGRNGRDVGRQPRKGSGRSREHGRGRGRRGRDANRPKPVEINEFEWLGVDWDDSQDNESMDRTLAAYELALEQVLDVMDLDIEYSIEAGDVIQLDFDGEDSEVLLEDEGRVLKAVEHVLPRMVRSLLDRSVPCNADCEGFRANHEKQLKDMAEKAAEDVAESGRKKLLPPMNPADRRIVHLALVDNDEVETVSEGHGFMKRVKVLPVDDYDDDYED